jgi:hypothetical protein
MREKPLDLGVVEVDEIRQLPQLASADLFSPVTSLGVVRFFTRPPKNLWTL